MKPANPVVDHPENLTDQSDSPLSPQDRQDLSQANQQARNILRAGNVATFNGWSASIFAGVSLLSALFSVTALCVGVGLAVIARNEFRGRKLLRWFDPRGTRLLGWNQIGFIVLLIAYSLWSIYVTLTGPNTYDVYIAKHPELAQVLGPIGSMYTTLTLAVYSGVIVFSVIFQGLNARYYFKKDRLLKAYLRQTPDWIVDLQRASL